MKPPELLSLVPSLTDMTDEQWAEHDARIRREGAAQVEAMLSRDRVDRPKALRENGFPSRAIEAALAADEAAESIARISAWDPRAESVIVLSGAAGCGKTVAATWWALKRSWSPLFLRATTFAASSRYDNDKRDAWTNAPALVIDDLGSEYADTKGNFVVDLDELIDTYYGDRKPLVITTNCTADQFKARYGARIADRLRECGAWFSVSNASLRRKP